MPLSIDIIDDARYERDEVFYVKLSNPTNGATFIDGVESQMATITIKSDEDRRKLTDKVAAELNLNFNMIELGASSWGEQFRNAVHFEGDGCFQMFCFVASLPWKLLGACIPPPVLCNGWLCFSVALVFIGETQPNYTLPPFLTACNVYGPCLA